MSSQAPKPNWPPLPAKSPFTAIPIADPDTHPSPVETRVKRRTKKGGAGSKNKDDSQSISPAELAKGPYKRVSKGVYEHVDDADNASRRDLPPHRVTCQESEVKVVDLLTSVSLDKDYGTYLMTWDDKSGFRKLPKTSVEPKEITLAEVMEFRMDAENAAKKNPKGPVDNFMKDHPGFYND